MPLPWPAQKSACFIPDISQRALTIQQIHDLRLFLQRLCKTRLLKHTSAHAKTQGLESQALDWHGLEMYQITNEVIRKVIPHIDPGAKQNPEPGRSFCSWAEFVASSPQPAQFMVSHWWGGRFQDFTAALDNVVADRGLSKYTTFWVCTFANNQWGEDLGTYLEQCPFVRTIARVGSLVLVVDRAAGSLTRSWCCLEIYYNYHYEKDLLVYTSAGEVGSKQASSGPLVEAVKHWDIRKSEASEPAYRRQILNFIGGVEQTSGLRVDRETGCLHISDGRPELEGEERQEHLRRSNGELEYRHEAALFAANSDRFEDLNTAVRLSVMARIGLPTKSSGCRIESFAQRGITLGRIRSFSRKLESACKTFVPPVRFGDVTVAMACENFLKPLTASFCVRAEPCSYVELVAEKPMVPTIYIDYAFRMKIADIFGAIEWFAEAMGLQDSAVFFWDLLAFNQHRIADEVAANFYSGKEALGYNLAQIECGSLLVCAEGQNFGRAWQAHVWESASRLGQDVYLASNRGVMACTTPFPSGGAIFGSLEVELAQKLSEVRVQGLEAFNDADRQAIVQWITEGPRVGIEGARADGASRFEHRLQRWSSGPLLRAAAISDDLAMVEKICSCPGLSMNCRLLVGSLGETALHLAAAVGSVKAMKGLLAAKMDPNAGDCVKETPLHYAAMAGQAEAIKLLLVAGADPQFESRFGERPLDVAGEGVASFLGVDYSAVKQVMAENLSMAERANIEDMAAQEADVENRNIVPEASCDKWAASFGAGGWLVQAVRDWQSGMRSEGELHEVLEEYASLTLSMLRPMVQESISDDTLALAVGCGMAAIDDLYRGQWDQAEPAQALQMIGKEAASWLGKLTREEGEVR